MFENEKVVESKICKHCEAKFEITDKDLEFYEKISPIFDGKKYLIPSPTLCPDCRQQRRLSFRNERNLYKRQCDASGKSIISIYSPDKPYKVYNQDIWNSDKWEPLDYGINFDFEKSFFEQFRNLLKEVPLKALVSEYNENCDYTSICGYCKDCYLISASEKSENCYYGHLIQNSKNIYDSNFIFDSEIIYEGIDCKKCFNCKYIINCNDCSNILLGVNLKGCNDCIMCSNLTNKSYYFNNKKLLKEEFLNKKAIINTDLKNFIKNNSLSSYFSSSFQKNLIGENNENCLGSYINDSKNVNFSYEIDNGNQIKYCQIVVDGSDLQDCSNVYIENNLSYEIMSALSSNYNIFSGFVYNCSNVIYSLNLNDSKNCFGCVGLKNKSYCILNKQYSKEEYEKIVPKIIEKMQETGEWGEFFPSSLSPFGYNETVANEYFPLTKEDVSLKHLYDNGKQIFNWSFYESPFPKVEKIITVEIYNNTSLLDSKNEIPNDILNWAIECEGNISLLDNANEVPDNILNWAIECEKTGKPFRIIKQELDFYRKNNLPIPNKHPDQRHLERMALRNPRKLFEKFCDKCDKKIKTTYSPDRKEIVYCESCYDKEVY